MRKAVSRKLIAFSAVGVFVCLLAGCGALGGSYKDDEQAVQQVNSINSRISSGVTLTAEDAEALRAIYEKYPDSKEVRAVYQQLLINRGDWGTLEKVIAAIPPSQQTDSERLNLAKVHFKLGNFEKVVETLNDMPGEPDVERAVLLGRALFSLGKYDEAAAALDSRWEEIRNGKNPDGLIARGLIYFHKGENSKALEVLNAALIEDPGSIPANNAISRVYASMGDDEKAREHLKLVQESFDRMTNDERAKTAVVSKLRKFQEAYQNKDFREVIRLGKELEPSLEPRNRLALYKYLFEAYKTLGMEKEALETMNKAKELSGR